MVIEIVIKRVLKVLLGLIDGTGVGKSWLLLRWAGETGKFSKSAQSMPTIGIDFKMKNIHIDNKRVKVQIVSIHSPSRLSILKFN